MPGEQLLPARLAPGDPAEVERAEVSWPQMRQLVKYLSKDGVEEGPWSWYGRRKPSLGNPLPPELARSSAQEEAVPVPDLGPSIIQAARELVATYRDKEPLAKERLAKAWEDAAPRLGCTFLGKLRTADVFKKAWRQTGSLPVPQLFRQIP
eukprot:g25729.t1